MNTNRNFAVTVAISVAAVLIIIIVPTWYEYHLAREVGKDFNNAWIKPMQAMAYQSSEQIRQQQIQREIIEQQRLAQIAAVQYQAQITAANKRSFEQNYRKPAGCENPIDMNAMIECSNHYMREKKKFNVANGNQ
jgi:hypothetical protein